MRTTATPYRRSGLRVTVITIMIAGILFTVPAVAGAATCTVEAGGHPTIQAAINDTNCSVITVPAGTYNENLTIYREITINGAGPGITIVDGTGTDRVLYVSASGGETVAIDGLTLRNGNTSSNGGAVTGYAGSDSQITISNSVISNSQGRSGGGAYLYASGGEINLVASTISNNTATQYGGGIEARATIGGTVSVATSTVSHNTSTDRYGGMSAGASPNSTIAVSGSEFSENTAPYGGGLYVSANGAGAQASVTDSAISRNESTDRQGGLTIYGGQAGQVEVTNSTISDNHAVSSSGGAYVIAYYADTVVTFANTTISGNSSGSSGAGLFGYTGFGGGRIEITHSTIADNTSPSTSGLGTTSSADSVSVSRSIVSGTCYGNVVSTGFNVFDGCALTPVAGDVTGDPLLGPLADNGGPTDTHELLDGSPAFDLVPTASCTLATDQRGEARPQRSGCDAGAFEVANSLPVAGDDLHDVVQDAVLTVASPGVLGNDTDADGDPLTAVLDSGPSNGTLALSNDGSFIFTPNLGFHGNDSFTYHAYDGEADSNSATVDIHVLRTCTVEPGGHATIQAAINNTTCDVITVPAGTYKENLRIEREVRVNGAGVGVTIIDGSGAATVMRVEISGDRNVALDGLTMTNGSTGASGGGLYATASSGAEVLISNAAITNSTAGYAGGAYVRAYSGGRITISDSSITGNTATAYYGGLSAIASPNSYVAVINSDISNNEAASYYGGIHANASGEFALVDSTISHNTSPRYGGMYTLAATSAGKVSITGSTFSDNSAEYIAGLSVYAYQGGQISIDNSTFSHNDSSGPFGGVVATSVYSNAEVAITNSTIADNAATYASALSGSTSSGVVTVAGSILDGTCGGVVTSNGFNLLNNCPIVTVGSDVAGDPMLGPLEDNGGPTETRALLPGSPAIDLIPDADCITATDQRGVTRPYGPACDAGAFEATNAAPQAFNDLFTTLEDTPRDVGAPGVMSNDIDADGDTLTAILGSGPSDGTLVFNSDGSFTYTPDLNFYGSDLFTYYVNDGQADSAVATVTINMTAVNDPPVADGQEVTTAEDTPIDIQLTGSDIDGTIIMMGIVDPPDHGTLTGTLPLPQTYTPDFNWNGTDTFTFIVGDDGGLDSEFATVTINVTPVNDPPVADANGPYSGLEGTPVQLDATGSWDAEDDPAAGDITMYEWDLDNDGVYDDASGDLVMYTFIDDGFYTIGLRVTDSFGASDVTTAIAIVSNVVPIATLTGAATVDEGIEYVLDVSPAIDPGDDTATAWIVHWGDGSSESYATPGSKTHTYEDGPSTPTIVLDLVDEDGTHRGVASLTLQVGNVAPSVVADVPTQTVQYSDPITDLTVSATDVDSDPLTIETSWSVDGGGFVAGLPPVLAISFVDCTPGGGFATCGWQLSGSVAVPAGEYVVRVVVDDGDSGTGMVDIEIVVEPEDATVAFSDMNPVSLQVATEGGVSGTFDVSVVVAETSPDLPSGAAAPGEIGLAEVSVLLVPVGPGPSANPDVPCTTILTGTGYTGELTATCRFDSVEVNTYSVSVTVDGGYYVAVAEDVLVVYDPSLGFTTGGGTFYWPDSDDKTNFGYTMKYNKNGQKVKGSFLLIRHVGDDDLKYRVKSNALYGLAIGEGEGMGWASFSGKATYLEPGWIHPIGNHEFIVYVEDHGEPGSNDRIWLEMRDRDDNVIAAMSMGREAPANAVSLSGGNIQVPH